MGLQMRALGVNLVTIRKVTFVNFAPLQTLFVLNRGGTGLSGITTGAAGAGC